ncbi:MAG TPA: sulfatase-like hydrolase/transferase, partial [Opitutus sp.]|nr:sulfatase-like hydrolase/transferase [Opitutus sp.]
FITHKPVESADPESDAHNVQAITDRAVRFLTEHRREPFFLLLSHNSVHAPIMAPHKLVAKYPPGGDKHPENVPVIGAMMEMLDDGVGQVLAKLDELGLRENTLVIFYSDNGGLLSNAAQSPLRGGKAQLHEGGIRVPLLVRWPGVIAPASLNEFATSTMDFVPTLLEFAGIPADRDAPLDGVSLAAALRGKGEPDRDTLFWHYPHYHPAGLEPSGAVLSGDWKLVEYYEAALTGQGLTVELFNLRDDPSEAINLASAQPVRAAQLRQRLADWRGSVGAQMPTLNPRYDPARAEIMETTPAPH